MSGGNKFQARLESQKAQLERNGYSAEVVVRTTPEATDMINFARLWEHILITADRRTRGYMSADKRADYEKTQKAFLDSVDYMMKNLTQEVERHGIDLTGNNFISRVAQRYKIAEPRKAKPKSEKPAEKASKKASEKAEANGADKTADKAKAEQGKAEQGKAEKAADKSESKKTENKSDAQVEGL